MPTKFDEFAAENLRGYNVHFINKAQQAFNAGRAAEREKLAILADKQANIDWDDGDGGQYGHGYETACSDIADEIRALNKEGE